MDELSFLKQEPLSYDFYKQPTLTLATEILGCILVKETTEAVTAGYIVETEAYLGVDDQAAHSFQNRRTKRTEIMFGPPGYTYTYTMHTHCLFNIVTGDVNQPEAVLVRAIEPLFNTEIMKKRRPKAKTFNQISNGPGKLTKALGITMADYGHPLTEKPLWITTGLKHSFQICSGPRIGIDNAGEAKHYPWRFWIKGNRFVSK